MQNFLHTLFICSVTMTVVSLLFMSASPLLSKRYSAKWQYYAWLIIIIGFIFPFRPNFNSQLFTVPVPASFEDTVNKQSNADRLETDMSVGNETITLSNTPNILRTDVKSTNNKKFFSVYETVLVIWMIGFIIVLGYNLFRHFRLMKMINRWKEDITDVRMLDILRKQKETLGIRKDISLQRCPLITGSMLAGFVKPSILLQASYYADEDLALIMKHELIHFKRKDLLFKILVLIAKAIHWFNPIIYMIDSVVSCQCEKACDDAVIENANTDVREKYALIIVDVAKTQSNFQTALTTNFYGGKYNMKNRILSIMNRSKKKMGILIIGCMLVVTLCSGMVFATSSPAYDNKNDKDETTEIQSSANKEDPIEYSDVEIIEIENGDKIIRYPAPGPKNNQSGYTEEDYAALMALKTDGYRELSTKEFNARISSIESIYSGFNPNDANVDFMKTLWYSYDEYMHPGMARTIAGGTGTNKRTSENEYYGAQVDYHFKWTIWDADQITVGERDDILNACIDTAQIILENKNRDALQSDDIKAVLQSEYNALVNKMSNNFITIEMNITNYEYIEE